MLIFLVSARDYWSVSLPLALIGLLLAWGLGTRADATRRTAVAMPVAGTGLQEVATPHAV
jgi:hypothetical protein